MRGYDDWCNEGMRTGVMRSIRGMKTGVMRGMRTGVTVPFYWRRHVAISFHHRQFVQFG